MNAPDHWSTRRLLIAVLGGLLLVAVVLSLGERLIGGGDPGERAGPSTELEPLAPIEAGVERLEHGGVRIRIGGERYDLGFRGEEEDREEEIERYVECLEAGFAETLAEQAAADAAGPPPESWLQRRRERARREEELRRVQHRCINEMLGVPMPPVPPASPARQDRG